MCVYIHRQLHLYTRMRSPPQHARMLHPPLGRSLLLLLVALPLFIRPRSFALPLHPFSGVWSPAH
eukprot:6116813-Pyramimonas_sp.AAC.1